MNLRKKGIFLLLTGALRKNDKGTMEFTKRKQGKNSEISRGQGSMFPTLIPPLPPLPFPQKRTPIARKLVGFRKMS